MNAELELASILGSLPDSYAEKIASSCEELSKEELEEVLLSEFGSSNTKEKLSWADSQGRILAHSLEKTALPSFLTPSVATAGKLMRGAVGTPAGLRAGIGAGIGGLGGMAVADPGNKIEGGLMGAGLGALGGAGLRQGATALASGKGRLAGALRKGLQSEIGAARKLGDTQALSALQEAGQSIKGARTERVREALKGRKAKQVASAEARKKAVQEAIARGEVAPAATPAAATSAPVAAGTVAPPINPQATKILSNQPTKILSRPARPEAAAATPGLAAVRAGASVPAGGAPTQNIRSGMGTSPQTIAPRAAPLRGRTPAEQMDVMFPQWGAGQSGVQPRQPSPKFQQMIAPYRQGGPTPQPVPQFQSPAPQIMQRQPIPLTNVVGRPPTAGSIGQALGGAAPQRTMAFSGINR